jgi:hypothetical protein
MFDAVCSRAAVTAVTGRTVYELGVKDGAAFAESLGR